MRFVLTRWRRDLVTMALAGGMGLAGSYTAVGPTRSFIGAQVESLVVGLIPGEVVATGLRWLGRAAELLVFGTALTIAAGLLGIGTAVVCRYISSSRIAGVGGGTWAGAVTLIVTGSVLSSAGATLADASNRAFDVPGMPGLVTPTRDRHTRLEPPPVFRQDLVDCLSGSPRALRGVFDRPW